ncbi:MAG: glutamine synthetase, partial [Actinomycetia bacterium]|nr:glutamine synthetase [Actinomycetes bacterium]
DIQTPDGKPFTGDPRYVLKRNLKVAADMGLTMYVGPELEFFYFEDSTDTKLLDKGGYFDLTPLDLATDYRRETVFALEEMGISVEYSHHEVAPSQHEIDLRYDDALSMADNVMTYRLTVKEIAQEAGIYATFMPKPIFGENGSGMHTHQSLFKGNNNIFFDADDEHHLSKAGKGYVAGILKHAKEITAVCNQWVNSYKRLVPGYEAPVYMCWSRRNRSALVRMPQYKPGKEHATRVELRSPDPACNPYLAFAVMLAAGLKGMKENYELAPEATDNIYDMTEAERKAANIDSLPQDLHEAIEIAEESELLKEALGEHVFEYFIRNKKAEWDAYKAQVSQYEVDRYLSIL